VAKVWIDAGWYFAAESRKTRQAPTPALTLSKAEQKRQATIAARDAADIRDADRMNEAA